MWCGPCSLRGGSLRISPPPLSWTGIRSFCIAVEPKYTPHHGKLGIVPKPTRLRRACCGMDDCGRQRPTAPPRYSGQKLARSAAEHENDSNAWLPWAMSKLDD